VASFLVYVHFGGHTRFLQREIRPDAVLSADLVVRGVDEEGRWCLCGHMAVVREVIKQFLCGVVPKQFLQGVSMVDVLVRGDDRIARDQKVGSATDAAHK